MKTLRRAANFGWSHPDRGDAGDAKRSYLTWYQATRHTFASHYMMAGGDLAKLQAELGHSDITTTQRYAKLSPDFRTDRDRTLIKLPAVVEGKVTKIGSKLVAGEVSKKREIKV